MMRHELVVGNIHSKSAKPSLSEPILWSYVTNFVSLTTWHEPCVTHHLCKISQQVDYCESTKISLLSYINNSVSRAMCHELCVTNHVSHIMSANFTQIDCRKFLLKSSNYHISTTLCHELFVTNHVSHIMCANFTASWLFGKFLPKSSDCQTKSGGFRWNVCTHTACCSVSQ